MKHTIYVITEDEHNCGTSTTVHSAEAECNAHLRRIIEHRIETFGLEPDADDTAQLDELKRCLDAGDVDGAWEVFQNGLDGEPTIKHPDDYYSCEAHEIELPGSTPSSTLADFATAVLEIMENETEWDAELLDRLAEEATTRGLAHTNGADGMFRRTPAKENASDVTQNLRWFIVHGREWGDDDDSTMSYHAATKEDAEAMFREEMGEENGACILTAENMHTKDDCTAHDHERIEDGPGCVFIITTFDCGEHKPQCL